MKLFVKFLKAGLRRKSKPFSTHKPITECEMLVFDWYSKQREEEAFIKLDREIKEMYYKPPALVAQPLTFGSNFLDTLREIGGLGCMIASGLSINSEEKMVTTDIELASTVDTDIKIVDMKPFDTEQGQVDVETSDRKQFTAEQDDTKQVGADRVHLYCQALNEENSKQSAHVSHDKASSINMRILPNELVPLVYNMPMGNLGDTGFEGIGGLSEQVREIKELGYTDLSGVDRVHAMDVQTVNQGALPYDMASWINVRLSPDELVPPVYNMLMGNSYDIDIKGIDGLSEQVREFKEVIELPLVYPKSFSRVGDSTDTEALYDTVEPAPSSKTVQKHGTINEEKELKSEEGEFVIVGHSDDKKQEEAAVLSKPDVESVTQEAVTLFDAIFGAGQPEKDSVLVTSLSGSKISDSFTTSTNSSTHRVAPPQSRESRAPASETSPVKKHSKKLPAPPPSKSEQSGNDCDAISGTPVPLVANELDESKFDAVFNNAETAVPSAASPFENEKVGFDNALNVPASTAPSFAFQGFQDSFDQSLVTSPTKPEPPVIKESPVVNMLPAAPATEIEPVSPPPTAPPTSFEPVLDAERHAEPVVQTPVSERHIDSVMPSTTSTNERHVQGEHRGVSNDSREVDESLRKKEEEDSKKKKKKKNIMSLVKSIRFSKKKKDKKEKINSVAPKHTEAPVHTQSPTTQTSFSASSNSSGVQDSHHDNGYDLDTIKGSHIAEMVNMGFDPAAALDDLDRYGRRS